MKTAFSRRSRAPIACTLVLSLQGMALGSNPAQAPEVLEVIDQQLISEADLVALKAVLPSEPIVIDAPYTAEKVPASAIKLHTFEIASGVLDGIIDPDQLVFWTDFTLLGGTVMVVDPQNGDLASLVAMLPSESVGPYTAVVSKSEDYFEDWFQELLRTIIEGLDWVDDPDKQGQPPVDDAPDDQAPAEDDPDQSDDSDDDPDSYPDPSETW